MPKRINPIVSLFNHTVQNFRNNGSVIPYGSRAGKGINQTLLREPDYIFFSRRQHPTSLLTTEMTYRIGTLDAKPILRACSCGRSADCFVSTGYLRPLLYKCSVCQPPDTETTNPYWVVGWCIDDLDRMFSGTFAQIRNQMRRAMRDIIRAKGYVGNITHQKANNFLP